MRLSPSCRSCLVRCFAGVTTGSMLGFMVNTKSEACAGSTGFDDTASNEALAFGLRNIEMAFRDFWSIPKLSLEAFKSSSLNESSPSRMINQSSSSALLSTVEYDFVVVGHGNAGKRAAETLKQQCPKASIALVDPIRLHPKLNDSRVNCYHQQAVGFHPPTQTVALADGKVQLKYRHAILVATGSRGAPPPIDLFDKQVLNRVLELRPTEASGSTIRPVLSPETIRRIAVMAAHQGSKVCVLGSGWEAVELVSAASKVGENGPMLAFGTSGPLSHILPRYLSTAVTKRLRQQGIDVHERSLVRYVSHFVSPVTKTPRIEVHTAKSFDLMETCRTHVDLLVVAPTVDGPRGTAVLPMLEVPEALKDNRYGRTWYQSWSQLTSPHKTPSTLVCFSDDGRLAVNAELNAAAKVYAAGSVAKYPNSVTGHAHVAGIGAVDGALAGQLAAMNMARDYHDRMRSARFVSSQETIEASAFASSSIPIFRSDIVPCNIEEERISSLPNVGIKALLVGCCDSDNMSTHGFWWTNLSDRRNKPLVKEMASTRKARALESPVYGSGIVFYIDRVGRLSGVMSWGLPFTLKESTELNPVLITRMMEMIKSNGETIHGMSDHSLLKAENLAEESKRLVRIAIEGIGSNKGLHRRLTNKLHEMPNPLHRYTAAKPPSVTSVGFLKRKDQTFQSELLGEHIYITPDEIYDKVPGAIRPPTLIYVYPMNTQVDQRIDPFLVSNSERADQAWRDNARRARPSKEEPIWLRRGDAFRGMSSLQMKQELFLSNMNKGLFADGSSPLDRPGSKKE